MEDEENKVIVESFTKLYGTKSNPIEACSNIDFTATKGIVTGIIGPNGAGKSSLLKAISGIHYASSGKIKICGISCLNEIREIVGFVPETPELDSFLTVKETLYQAALLHSVDNKDIDYNIERVVKQLELQSVIDKKTSILSKGFKQRVSIAKAIVFNPKVLVLDEFSGGLDPAQIVSIRKLIQNIAKDCITILSTHHIEDALSLCTYIYIINQGHIVSSGTPQEITNNTHTANLEEAFLCLTKN